MRRRKIYIILGGILLVSVLSAAGVLLYGRAHYKECWYNNTFINEMNVSGLTLEESKANMEQLLESYTLFVKGRDGGNIEIVGKDIGLKISYDEKLAEAFQEEHATTSFLSGGDHYTVEYDVSYDAAALENMINNSRLVNGDEEFAIVSPVSATVKYSDEKNQYVCVPEVNGNKVNPAELLAAVKESLARADKELDITDAEKCPNVYEKPAVTSGSPELQSELEKCNAAAVRCIVWNMGEGRKEKITPKKISKWISYKNGTVKYNDKAIRKWVEKFCLTYKTVGITRKVRTHNKKYVKVAGGDYGWQIDFDSTLKQLKEALKKSVKGAARDAYIANPSDETMTGITLKQKVKYANTAFQRDFENMKNDWDPKNYTEVSLSEQKVYVIRKGKVAFSCRCITGRPVPDRQTRTGTYFIKEHQPSRVLVGENYRTPVTNWVRIMWTGTGFHAAPWQSWSSWSPDRYKTRGSHGCVNLSQADSQKIYKMTKYREAVFIH